jgi:CHAD domain-containing protein
MTMEVEAKFLVPDEATLARLIETAQLAGCDVEPGEPRRDVDTFLDTPDRRLLAEGYYFRRRETDDGVRLTLKQLVAPSEGVLRREEIEALVAADVPIAEWPAGGLRQRVEQLTGGEPLEAMLTLSQVRVARVVRRGRREVAELSLDRVTASAPDGDRGWLEAEVEARGRGAEADVAALAAELRDEWGLVPEGRAKFTRALELAGDEDDGFLMAAEERKVHEAHASGEGARARRAQALLALDRGLSQIEAGRVAGLSDRRVRYWLARYRVEGTGIYDDEAVDPGTGASGAAPAAAPKKRPDIRPSDTMTEAAVKTLRFHLAKMLEYEEGTRLGEDPEELHDMRVSTRRMRMALRVFADYLDPEVLRALLKGLRSTGRTLGAVRDLDVFNEKTQVYLDGLADERAGDLDGLLAAWKAERDKQRERLVEYLDGKRYRRFVQGTTELLEGPIEALAPQSLVTPRPQRVAQVLPGVLYKDMAVVWAFEGQLGGLETPLPRFHALRKACKGLRYTLEFFEDVLGSGARPLIKRVKGLQDHLGDLQDAVVTAGVLRDYITWGTWRHEGHDLPGPIEVIVAPGAARYLTARQEEMERLVVTFPEVWPTVAGNEFSRELAAVIAEIQPD